MMLFDNEAKACIDGVATASEQLNAAEYYQDGGFHCNVMPATRDAFLQWLESYLDAAQTLIGAHPRHLFDNADQLDLLQEQGQ